jgi:hypothetical protein
MSNRFLLQAGNSVSSRASRHDAAVQFHAVEKSDKNLILRTMCKDVTPDGYKWFNAPDVVRRVDWPA